MNDKEKIPPPPPSSERRGPDFNESDTIVPQRLNPSSSPSRTRKAVQLLQKAVDKLPELKGESEGSYAFTKWNMETLTAIEYAFGKGSRRVTTFRNITLFESELSEEQYLMDIHPEAYVSADGLGRVQAVLESMINELEIYHQDEISNVSNVKSRIAYDKKKVFVVHGHDEAALNKVARFLEKLGLKPVILREQANKGRAIIEKIEDYTDVGFAVVLLTPDDVGAPRNSRSAEANSPRARQNVILELGFLLGKIGRKNICILKKHDVEIPSDYDGVVYTDFDDKEAWQMKVVNELKAAGFQVDANQAIQ